MENDENLKKLNSQVSLNIDVKKENIERNDLNSSKRRKGTKCDIEYKYPFDIDEKIDEKENIIFIFQSNYLFSSNLK